MDFSFGFVIVLYPYFNVQKYSSFCNKNNNVFYEKGLIISHSG